MASGFAFGAGSAVAHHAVGSLLGGRSSNSESTPAQQAAPAGSQAYGGSEQSTYASQEHVNPCQTFNMALLQCLQSNNNQIGICQSSMDQMVQCERDNANIV